MQSETVFNLDSFGAGGIGGAGGWFNPQTGLGDPNEQTRAEFMPLQPLNPQSLANLYYGDPLAAVVVEKHPKAALRKPPRAVNPNVTPEQRKRVNQALMNLGWVEKSQEAATFARLFGNAGIWLASPTDQSNPRGRGEVIRFLKGVDRRCMYVGSYYTEPMRENAGAPASYAIVPIGHVLRAGEEFGSFVHESRIAMFRGLKVDPIQRSYNAGWDYSILQRCINVVRSMGETWEGVSTLLRELSIKLLKVKGLAGQLLARPYQTETSLAIRRRQLSVLKMLAIDSDSEEFSRVETSALTGAAAVLELILLQVAAAADMPVSELYGRSPTGLNNTGEFEAESWRNTVAAYQASHLREPMTQIACAVGESVLPGSGADWSIEFPPLVEETRAQRTAARRAIIDADAVQIQNGVYTPEQIAVLRSGPAAEWEIDYSSIDTTLARALAGAGDDGPGDDRTPPPPSTLPGAGGRSEAPGTARVPPPPSTLPAGASEASGGA